MSKNKIIGLLFFLTGHFCFSQPISCSYVYMDGGSYISYYDPSQPLSSSNPSQTSIPTLGSGLALMPNINGGTLSPTFYTTSGGNYYYWSGTSWVNTGHSTGNSAAVNIAGCGSTIYNLVGSSGQVYSYNGTGNGSLLTTLSGFNGGGPYDLVCDCNCNFYALNTTTPSQGLSMYNPSGVLQCTYTLSGMPNASAGGGFAIIGNMIYVKNNNTPGFYIGTISGGGVTFTAVTGFTNSPGDFASCPVCYGSSGNITGNISAPSGGTLSCSVSSVNLAVTTTVTGVGYSWSGPGITPPATGSAVTVSSAGVYSCIVGTAACPPVQSTFTFQVVSNTMQVTAAITPTGSVCAELNSPIHLVVASSSTNANIMWTGPAMTPITGTSAINVIGFGTYTVKVTDIATGCQASNTVTINQTPTVALSLSSNTLCLQNNNGSPNSITLTASGAVTYTLLGTSNYSVNNPNATVMTASPFTGSGNLSPFATATLIGSNGFCRDTSITTFTIYPNPVVSLSQSSASICPGDSKTINVIGASTYTWSGPAGLSQYTGSTVAAYPLTTSSYTVIGSDLGCRSLSHTLSVVVLPLPVVSITPTVSTICLASVQTLTANGTATSFSWMPSTGIISSSNSAVVSVSPPTSVVYKLLGALNTCTSLASATVNIVQPPVLSLGLSSPTLCAYNYNGSPNAISLVPSGATNYTLLADNSVMVSYPNGPVMQATSTGTAFGSTPAVVNTTLIGQQSVCTVSITQSFSVLPNPTLMVNPPSASVCPGHSQAFSVSGAITYTWLPATSYTITSNTNTNIVANPSLTTFYSVIGSDNGCKSATKNAVLVILPIPEVSISPSSSTVCAGNSITLTAEGNGTMYNWTPSTGLSSNSGQVVIATPASFQTYTVTATLNTCTNQAMASVSVITIPVIHASSPQPTICSSASTPIYVNGATSYLWYPSDNLNSPSGNVVIASPGQSTTYTIHGYNGICTGSTTIFIQTVERPDIVISASSNEVCIGSAVEITVKGAQDYTWSPVSALIPTGTNTRVVAAPVENTNYTVVGANYMGTVSCYEQMSYSVMVVPLIKPVVSKDAYLCRGQRTTLYASGGNTFSWTPSFGLNITNGAGVVASPSATTIYTVTVSHDSYCGRTTTVMVAVNDVPQVYAGRDTTYNINEAIFINAQGTGTLSWISGEDIICPDCPQTQIYPTHDGCYIAQAINDAGCTATDDICITLTEDFTIYVPNSFSPNHDGINDHFLIFGENISEVSLEIFDRWGTKIFYSGDMNVGWDGNYKNVACPSDVYTYIIHYTGLNHKKYTKTGNVNLMK